MRGEIRCRGIVNGESVEFTVSGTNARVLTVGAFDGLSIDFRPRSVDLTPIRDAFVGMAPALTVTGQALARILAEQPPRSRHRLQRHARRRQSTRRR